MRIYLLLPSPCHTTCTPSTINQLTLRFLSAFQTLASANNNNFFRFLAPDKALNVVVPPLTANAKIVRKISANSLTVPGVSPLLLQYVFCLPHGSVQLLSHVTNGAHSASVNFSHAPELKKQSRWQQNARYPMSRWQSGCLSFLIKIIDSHLTYLMLLSFWQCALISA